MSPLGTKGEKGKNMKNNKKGTGRDIIVSCFEVFPYDPEECIWNMEQKCIGEVSVNTKKKTISFKYLGGTAPILYVMLLVMTPPLTMGPNCSWIPPPFYFWFKLFPPYLEGKFLRL